MGVCVGFSVQDAEATTLLRILKAEKVMKRLKDSQAEYLFEISEIARDPAKDSKRDMKSLFGTEEIPETYIIRNNMVESRFINAQDWMLPKMLDYLGLVVK